MKKINILLITLLISLTGCYDLNKLPNGELSSATAFKTTAEITKYLNQFYENAPKAQPYLVGDTRSIAFGDQNSDNMIGNVIDTRLAGETALSDAERLNGYRQIRNVNFLITNLGNCNETGPVMEQCIGEAYFFRAWYYYQLFIDYGELTWLTEPLDPAQEQMERPRDSRTTIADNILKDLDKAIENLNLQNNSAKMRIHKDVARILKSEVALFEGTWEKYHKAKKTPFYDSTVTDEKIKDYFTQAAQAAKEVIDRGVWKIATGETQSAYQNLFITLDLSNNSEVLWWKKYDASSNIGHSVTRYLNKGGGITGASQSLINDYLTIEGKPFTAEQRKELQKEYGKELLPTLRDPRLAQSICTPGQELRPNGEYQFLLPPLDGNSYNQNTTGYSILKFVEYNTTYIPTIDGEGKSQAPAIQFRYADALLNYAEALAELDGARHADKIKASLEPLRNRVGMPAVDFDREYNTAADYPFSHLDKYIQAVRRERRVEKAFEGKRLWDILRWAAADELIVNKTPIGALFVGSNLEQAYDGKLIYDKPTGNNLYLTGKPGDTIRYIIPFNNSDYSTGWTFDVKRDYLLPIQPRMLTLTNNQWKQNPGW